MSNSFIGRVSGLFDCPRNMVYPCAKAMCDYQKAALIQHQRYAHDPNSSSVPKRRCANGRHFLDERCVILSASLLVTNNAAKLLPDCFIRPRRFWNSGHAKRALRFIPSMLRRLNASAKAKAHKPYEFGVKVSIATTLSCSKGGQFALHACALTGNPYDGHTLATVIPDMERSIGNQISRLLADAGYRGHNAPTTHKFRIFTAGQKTPCHTRYQTPNEKKICH